MPQVPLCHTSTRPEHSVSPPLSLSFSLSEKAAAPPVTALVGGRSPWEPQGRGRADVPVQGAAVGQLLGLLPAHNGETVDQGQLGVILSPNKII